MRSHRTIKTHFYLPTTVAAEDITRFISKAVSTVFPGYWIEEAYGAVVVSVNHNGTQDSYRECRRIACAFEAAYLAPVVFMSREVAPC